MADNRRVAVLVGSLRRESLNRRLALALAALAPPALQLGIVEIGELPPFNQDWEADPPQPVHEFKGAIARADAVLFVTPEYNRSVPGVLKNALDVGSRPYGQNAWAGKPGGVLSASIGATGGAMAQQHLRNVLTYLDVPTLCQPETYIQVGDGFFDADGGFALPRTQKYLQGWMDRYVAWVRKHAG